LKNPSEVGIALETGATTTALVYPGAGGGAAGRAPLVLARGVVTREPIPVKARAVGAG